MTTNRLLLIEDNEADARLVQEYLSETRGNGLSLSWEESLGGGVSTLREGGVDCVLLDLGLPGASGMEPVDEVVEAADEAPVLVLTGLDDEETAVEAMRAGAEDYLRKDEMTPTSLRRAVRYATERRSLQRELQEQLTSVLNTLSEGVVVVGPDLEWQFANPAAERLLGLEGGESRRRDPGSPPWTVRRIEDSRLPDGRLPSEHVLRTGRPIEDVQMAVTRFDGEEMVLSVSAAPLGSAENEGTAAAVVSLRDVTDRHEFEQELRHRALHDTLTGLPNRALFHDRLEHALESVRRTNATVAVLFLDLDRFKVINDSLGHEAGDRLLERIAERLQTAVRDADTVARMGGDEFTILLEGLEDPETAEEVARRVLSALEPPISLGEEDVHVEASVGIATRADARVEDGLSEADALVARADEAMFRAKETPGTSYRVFSSDGSPAVTSQLELETRLRRALEEGAIGTAYQPIFDLSSGRIVGLEALARWSDPELGQVSPGRFIPMAEETGLITELGRQQMLRACRDVQTCRVHDASGEDLRLHANVSMGQLDDPGFVRQMRRVLTETGFPVERLWLEITESVTMRQPERLAELSELGARLTVDDFGTRYSTLAQLKRLDLNGLKVDRSFVDGVGEDVEDEAIVESVTMLGHRLGLDVVAEGVETEEQLDRLREIGCDHAQGFLLGRPMPLPEVLSMLEGSAGGVGKGASAA